VTAVFFIFHPENFTTFTPQPPHGQCLGTDWFAHGDFCYLLRGNDRQTFYEAQLRCQEQQAHLTSVHDSTTVEFLVAMVIPQTAYNVWIGLYGSETGQKMSVVLVNLLGQ